MNKTPLLEFVYNRKKTATKNREAAVELRITFERKQKYMTTGIRLLPKHWHRGSVVNRIDAREMNETLEKLMAEVRQVILEMMSESVMDIFSIQERLKRKRASTISFLEFCEQRTKIRQYGKADDSQERYNRFMRFFSAWGKIRFFEDVTDANILLMDGEFKDNGKVKALYRKTGTVML